MTAPQKPFSVRELTFMLIEMERLSTLLNSAADTGCPLTKDSAKEFAKRIRGWEARLVGFLDDSPIDFEVTNEANAFLDSIGKKAK